MKKKTPVFFKIDAAVKRKLLEKIYFANDKNRLFITALFNFFVALTKQAHLVHIIVASSDGCFLNTVYNDSRLKKCAAFYEVDYLKKKNVMEWLLNLEKYSRIKDYTLNRGDAEKIRDAVGGSMWEIQYILSQLFKNPIDKVLTDYKQRILGMITYYITQKGKEKSGRNIKTFYC
ncbi:MAG: ATP-binding protein [Candidatus Aminicenantes bacterium]|nr:ATP-binding protein [Candidatus Aminicenantes bacterium]